MSWVIVVLAVMSLGGFFRNGSMDDFVRAKPHFSVVADLSTTELPHVVKWTPTEKIATEDDIMMTVGNADFCFFVEVEKLEKQLVEFRVDESFGNLSSLARADCRIIEDQFSVETGNVALFFSQVNIPGKIHFDPPLLSNSIIPGSRALVFGKIEDGFFYVPKGGFFLVGKNGEKYDLNNKSLDKNTMVNFLEKKKLDMRIPSAKTTGSIAVLVELIGDRHFQTSFLDETAEFSVLKNLAGDTPEVIRLSGKNNKWDIVNAARFKPREKYVLLLEPGKSGEYFLVAGKASVFHFDNDEVRSYSGASIGTVEFFVSEFKR